jgi:hypothetical protein
MKGICSGLALMLMAGTAMASDEDEGGYAAVARWQGATKVKAAVYRPVKVVAAAPARRSMYRRHRNSYADGPPECRYAWREEGGPSGNCVPPRQRNVIEALAPYGSKLAGEFYRELDRDKFGSNDGGF